MTEHNGMTRRGFLRLIGLAGLTSTASLAGFATAVGNADAASIPSLSYRAARAFRTTPVFGYGGSTGESNIVRQLWQDEVVTVRRWSERWAETDEGLVDRLAVQPVFVEPQLTVNSIPRLVEVRSGSAPVHAWCSPEAPLITRIGHHGVARAVDRLDVSSDHWLKIETGGEAMGWTQASFWSPIEEPAYWPDSRWSLQISRAQHELMVLQDGDPLCAVPATVSAHIAAGTYSVSRRAVEASYPESQIHGAPYVLWTDDLSLSGAYWHNAFGTAANPPGADIQVPPAAAAWIYQHLPSTGSIQVL